MRAEGWMSGCVALARMFGVLAEKESFNVVLPLIEVGGCLHLFTINWIILFWAEQRYTHRDYTVFIMEGTTR